MTSRKELLINATAACWVDQALGADMSACLNNVIDDLHFWVGFMLTELAS